MPGQHYFIAVEPTKAIRYAGKAIGFVTGTDEADGLTMAEVGIIAATTGDMSAMDAYADALHHPGRSMPAGGVLRAR